MTVARMTLNCQAQVDDLGHGLAGFPPVLGPPYKLMLDLEIRHTWDRCGLLNRLITRIGKESNRWPLAFIFAHQLLNCLNI